MNFPRLYAQAYRDAGPFPTLEEFSRRVQVALTRCPECGGQPLQLAGSQRVRCGCGWTGVALRRLP